MSTLESPARAARGRVLVIGDPVMTHRAVASLEHPIARAESIFDALGQLAAATAREPVVAVVLSSTELGSPVHEVAASIRKLDPAVPLVLLHSGALNESDAKAVGSVVDDIVMSDDAEGLQRAIDGRVAPGNRSQAQDRRRAETTLSAETAGPTESSVNSAGDQAECLLVETTLRTERIGPPEARPTAAVHSPVGVAIPVDSPISPQPTAPVREDGEDPDYFIADVPELNRDRLGDVDLIDAILQKPEALVERAIRLIVQQTGFSDIQLLQDQPRDGALDFAAVCHGGQRFGFLASARARPDELATWADWLARWLALGQSHARHRQWAYQDDLTEAWNRRYFNEFLAEVIRAAQKQRRPVTLMVFDIDDFKQYNDRFGHEAGDEILRETVKLLTSVIRKGDRVCRIGGDEFAVIFADPEGPREAGSSPPETVEQIARRFQDQICAMKFPKLAAEAPGPLTISAGLATYPWDGHDPASLLTHADELALESKRRGKNVMTFGPGADRERADADAWKQA